MDTNIKNPIETETISRREFTRRCALGAVALASSSILGMSVAKGKAEPANGPARFVYPLDKNWLFGGKFNANSAATDMNSEALLNVTLPHCVVNLSWENWDLASWESVWVYRRNFSVPKEAANRRIFVKFDGVMVSAKTVINGVSLPEHTGGYLPFQHELTQYIKAGDNLLEVDVDGRWQSVPPEGSPKGPRGLDYLEPAGIFRSVNLHVLPQVFISDVHAKPMDVLEAKRRVEVACSVNATGSSAKSFQAKVELKDGARVVATAEKTFKIEQDGETIVALTLSDLGNIELWDTENPRLYEVVTMLSMDGAALHDHRTRVGFREVKFTSEGFFLNGKRVQLFGLNRHEIYPYVGGAMPARVMRRDAEMLRKEFNCNVVRCSHYPQTEAFLDACDELGLMVWQETPGWGYLGDQAWKELVYRDVGDMIRRDRNHAAIIIWGVRVNESRNDQPLYRRTTELAKMLDGTRPTSGSMTGGSRKNWKQEWHQDVFAMDDYHSAPDGSVGIDKPLAGVPYMLAETVGQFSYGTKGFNNKYRRAGDLNVQVNQGLYHAQAHDRAMESKGNSGVIAWCAFDYASLLKGYNGVKCPGVADVFRIPKLAGYFYHSQVSPKVRPVIAPNFYWDFGPKSPQGPGKGASIFSNCERLEIFVGGKSMGTLQPDRKNYPRLKYPPFFCDLEPDGAGKPELRIDGYVGTSLVLSKTFSADATGNQFLLLADDAELIGDGADATRLVFKVVDKYGTERAFATGDVTFKITGPGVLVGDNPFSLADSGGVGAVWVKTVPNKSGNITVTATHSTLGKKSVEIKVRAEA